MKISQLVIDTFLHLPKNINLNFYQEYKVAKWGVNGNANFTVIGVKCSSINECSINECKIAQV
jgi:hypothetical protein